MSQVNEIGAGHGMRAVMPAQQGKPDDPRTWKVAQDFEAVFMSQLVKSMRTSESQNELIESSAGHDIFNDMFSEAIATNIAKNGALGLTPVLYRELGGTYAQPKDAVEKAEEYDAS